MQLLASTPASAPKPKKDKNHELGNKKDKQQAKFNKEL